MRDKLLVCMCSKFDYYFSAAARRPNNNFHWRTETIHSWWFPHTHLLYFQIDLRHLLQSPDSDIIEIGIDLQDYYISVEWEILKVPAIRNEKVSDVLLACAQLLWLSVISCPTFTIINKFLLLSQYYSCCEEPYHGEFLINSFN